MKKRNFKQLTAYERDSIAFWKSQSKSNKWIAKKLNRHPTTIGREIKKNSFKGGHYVAIYAQAKTRAGLAKARQRHPLRNPHVYAYVIDKLRCGWSPEQIAGRLKRKYPNSSYWHICHETIYAYIYHPDNKDRQLWEYLRRKQKRRRKKLGRKAHRVRIPDRVSIHLRPKAVDKRKQIGHWEGDSIVGRAKTNGLHTEYERVSSLIRFEKLNRINAQETKLAMKKIFDPLPKPLKRSSTVDNGLEMAKHKEVDIPVYFADPYASYQRGGNENANLWIRYYFPKGTDFSKISDEELKDVEQELNNRPRKRLHYATPQEVFNNYLKGCTAI